MKLQNTLQSVACCALVLIAACSDPATTAKKYRERGFEYQQVGDFEKARVEYLNALRIDGNDAEARYGAGLAFESVGSLQQAMGHFVAAVEADPTHVPSRIALAKIYVMARSADKADQYVQQVLEIDPASNDAKALQASVFGLREDFASAEQIARQVIQQDPSNRYAVPLLSSRLMSSDRSQEALRLVEDAIARKPDFVGFRAVYAQMLWEIGDEDGYLEQLQTLTRLEPDVPGHVVSYASALENAGRQSESLTLLSGEAFKPDGQAALKLAYVKALQQHRPEALSDELSKLIDAFPESYDLQLVQASIAENSGNVARAKTLYEEISQVDSSRHSASALLALARIYLAEGNREHAKMLVGQVRKDHPSHQAALLLSSRIATQAGDDDTAIGELRMALRDDPENPVIYAALADAYTRNRQPLLAKQLLHEGLQRQPENIDLHLKQASVAMQLGDFELVQRAADEVLKQSSANVAALEFKYRGYLALSDTEQALAIAEEISSLVPDSGRGPFYSGAVYQALLQPGRAESAYAESLHRQPGSAEPLSSLLRLLLSQKRFTDAEKLLGQQRQAVPDNPLIQKYMGDVALAQKQYDSARSHYREVISNVPELSVTYKALAQLHRQQGEVAKTIDVLKEGVDRTQDRSLFAALAAAHQADQNIDGAIDVYRQALGVYRTDVLFANNLAMLLAEFRDTPAQLEEALTWASLISNSDNPAYLDTLGWVHYKRGDYDEAVRVLRRAALKVPDSGLLQYHLAKALMKQGQSQEALKHLKLAAETDQQYRGVEDAQTLLGQLTSG